MSSRWKLSFPLPALIVIEPVGTAKSV